jgi:hypothetical protein
MTAPKMMLASGCAGLLDEARGLVDLEQAEVRTALDGQQDAVRAVDARLEQRARDGRFGGLDRAVLAAGRADAHERAAGALHDRLDVGEVEVDQTRRRDQIGDALDTGEQHLIGRAERVEHADVLVADRQQPVVRDGDEGVDLSRRLAIPESACVARRRPSKVNGRVTTPMVSAPRLRAIRRRPERHRCRCHRPRRR